MSRYRSLGELYLARLREFYRQPARIFWVYGFPLVLAVGLGVAFRSRLPEPVRVTVVESPRGLALRSALDAPSSRPGQPGIAVDLRSKSEALQRLRTGKTPLVVAVDDGGGSNGGVLYIYDPTRPEALAARAAADDRIQRAAGRRDPVATRDQEVDDPGARYIDFLIPGLMGLNAMGGGMWGIGFLLVNFRVNKLLKRYQATPMPRSHFLTALLGARLTFLMPDMIVLLAMGHYLFGMPIRGSLALVVVIEIVGALAFAGLGLLIACRAQTTETVSGLMNLVMLPMWLFSGVFFSPERFPAAFQPLVQALPLTHIISALRRVILEGAGLAAVSGSLLVLTLWALVTFLLALRLFRWS